MGSLSAATGQGDGARRFESPRERLRPIEDLFDPQRTPSDALPDPMSLVMNLTRCVVEILAGARDLEQLSRWVSPEVYESLEERASLRSRARSARGRQPIRPRFAMGSTRIDSPADGVTEAVTIVHEPHRSRAIAMRLVGLDGRWVATRLIVL